MPTTCWKTTTIDGVEYLVYESAQFRVPNDFDPVSNMFIAVAAPPGGMIHMKTIREKISKSLTQKASKSLTQKASKALAQSVSDTVAELRRQGESIPSEFKCSNCQHFYHPEALTLTAARTLLDHNFDPNYDAATDDSPIICPGSESSHLSRGGYGVTANLFHPNIFNVDFDTDTFKVMLCTSKYIPSTHHIYKSYITHEVSGPGYTAGGARLTSTTVERYPNNNSIRFDGADTVWAYSSITARHAILYQDSPPGYTICHIDFGHDVTSAGGNFTIVWDGRGIFSLQTA